MDYSSEPVVILRNPSPNSALSFRPQELISEKEDICAHHSIPYTDRCRKELSEESQVIISSRNPDMAYEVDIEIFDTMKDMKFKKTISRRGGADFLSSFKQEF